MESNLFFNSQEMPPPKGEFVIWCDAMGTKRALLNSLHFSANCVFRIHSAFSIAQAKVPEIRVYPVMDGVYATARSLASIQTTLSVVFSELGREFVHARGAKKMFLPRAGLAYGATLHGQDIPETAFYGSFADGREVKKEDFEVSALAKTKNSILLSPAMVHSHQIESSAPPFGIAIHESARIVPGLINEEDGGLRNNFYKWWAQREELREEALLVAHQVNYYFERMSKEPNNFGYPIESIQRHRALAAEYFGGLQPMNESGISS